MEAYFEIVLKNTAARTIPQISVRNNGAQIAYYDSLSSGATLTHIIPIDTSVAGVQTFDLEVWTRFGHPNFAQLFWGGSKTVEIIEQKPGFPPGISTDDNGNLIIDTSLLGIVLPQSNGQGWIEITVDGKVLRTGGQGSLTVS